MERWHLLSAGHNVEMRKLTPSPSITSTSFGCVVPFLEMGIVRPSRCVIVLSKPSNAYDQYPLNLMTFQSLPLRIRSSSIFLAHKEPTSLPTVIARHRITLARLAQLCSPFSPRVLSPLPSLARPSKQETKTHLGNTQHHSPDDPILFPPPTPFPILLLTPDSNNNISSLPFRTLISLSTKYLLESLWSSCGYMNSEGMLGI